MQALLSIAANVLFTAQARRAASASQQGASQPMLAAPNGIAFHEPTTWGLATLLRCSLITLAGGSLAGGQGKTNLQMHINIGRKKDLCGCI